MYKHTGYIYIYNYTHMHTYISYQQKHINHKLLWYIYIYNDIVIFIHCISSILIINISPKLRPRRRSCVGAPVPRWSQGRARIWGAIGAQQNWGFHCFHHRKRDLNKIWTDQNSIKTLLIYTLDRSKIEMLASILLRYGMFHGGKLMIH